MRKLKRIAAPKWWPIERKVKKYILTPRGSHPRKTSLPLLVLIRDVFKIVETAKEAKTVIKKGEVLVDGKKRKDPHYGVGLFDVVEIPSLKKSWRAIPKKGLSFIEIPQKEAKVKICKIIDKKTLKGNKTQFNLHDGKNILSENKYLTNDSLLIELPSLKIIDHFEFKEGSLAIVTSGKKACIVTKINKIEKNTVWMGEQKTFEVPKKLVVVVGKERSAIKLM